MKRKRSYPLGSFIPSENELENIRQKDRKSNEKINIVGKALPEKTRLGPRTGTIVLVIIITLASLVFFAYQAIEAKVQRDQLIESLR